MSQKKASFAGFLCVVQNGIAISSVRAVCSEAVIVRRLGVAKVLFDHYCLLADQPLLKQGLTTAHTDRNIQAPSESRLTDEQQATRQGLICG